MKEWILSKFVKQVLNDPAYKDYYCHLVENKHGDKFTSPVLDHENNQIYEAGLRLKIINRELKDFQLIGVGSEDDISDLKYQFDEDIKEDLK